MIVSKIYKPWPSQYLEPRFWPFPSGQRLSVQRIDPITGGSYTEICLRINA